jgi:ABC-type polysaccharide/polyol phosphate export permease
MLAAFFAWLCFYETNTRLLLQKLATVLNPLGYNIQNFHAAIALIDPTEGFVMSFFLLMALGTLFIEWLSLRKSNEPYFYLRKPLTLCILVALTILLAPPEKNDFIYFAF